MARLIGGHLALLVARLAERRVTCCLNYTVAGRPCATCPLLPPEETRRRLRDPASPGRISDPAGDARRRR